MNNKTSIIIFSFLITGVLILFTNSCKKEDQGRIPTLTTAGVSTITKTSAISGGYISSDGGSKVIARGTCYSTRVSPTINDSITSDGIGNLGFRSIIEKLTPNTTYYVRAYATNSSGTVYGEELSFKTLLGVNPETVTDFDGNIYHSVTIGTQVWMVENLKVTHFRNGDLINKTGSNTYCCDYDNVPSNSTIYGKLYNWYAVEDGRNLAPTGWHVPTAFEWTTLTNFLTSSGYGYEGSGSDIAKALAATTGWSFNYKGGTIGKYPENNNNSGFTAVPGGFRNEFSMFLSRYEESIWWYDNWQTSISINFSSESTLIKTHGIGCYFAIRCVKD